MPRNGRSGLAGDAIDRPRQQLPLACLRELRAPVIVLTGDHNVTTERQDVWDLRATAHDVDGAKTLRASELQDKLAHRRARGGLGQPVARLEVVRNHGHRPSRKGVHHSLRGVFVREIIRNRYDPFRRAYDEFAPGTFDVQKDNARAGHGTLNTCPKRLDNTDALKARAGR